MPSAIAQSVNSAWAPAGTPMNDGSGRWSVDCNAVAPAIGLTISSHVFHISKLDMLWNQNGVCWSTVVDEQNGAFVLGFPLLTNVIVSFNLYDRVMCWQEPRVEKAIATSSSAVGPSATASTAASVSISSVSASVPPTSTSTTATATSVASPKSSSATSTQATTLLTSPMASSATVPTTGSASVTTSSSTSTSGIAGTSTSTSSQSSPPPITAGGWTTTLGLTATSTTTLWSIVFVSTLSAA